MRCSLCSRASQLYVYYVSPLYLQKVASSVTMQFISGTDLCTRLHMERYRRSVMFESVALELDDKLVRI